MPMRDRTMKTPERKAAPKSPNEKDCVLAKRRRFASPNSSKRDDMTEMNNSSLPDASQHDALRPNVPETSKYQQQAEFSGTDPATSTKTFQQPSFDSMLHETVVTIECADDLNTHYQVPLLLLCTQSQKQSEVFMQAQDLRERYAKVKAFKIRAEAIHPLLELHGLMYTEKCRNKAIALILQCLDAFPLATYQEIVAQRLIEAVDKVFKKNDLFISPPGKKFDRSNPPMDDVRGRLAMLRDEAVYTVLERLKCSLRLMKSKEKREAYGSVIKAAAQGRILLPKDDPATVLALVQWLYKDGLLFSDANHLCDIQALADRLGITQLSAECMDLLSSATSSILRQAKCQGLTLKSLLSETFQAQDRGHEPDSDGDPLTSFSLIGDVFKIVLKKEKPPTVLQDLVVEAIADSGDLELFNELLPVISYDMRGEIGVAMMRLAKVKADAAADREQGYSRACSGASCSTSIKSERLCDEDNNVKQD